MIEGRRLALLVGAMLALILIRCLIASLPYSGFNVSPKHGDYEAQRHWMEITTSLPISQWYFNTTNNDLMYWGLDYPPLTAYHSWLLGKLSDFFEPGSVDLHTSRGYETPSHKLFMRATVIVTDILLLFPAIYYLITVYYGKESSNRKFTAFAALAMHPGLLLIDHGHFQYNGISLALALLGVAFIMDDHDYIGSFFFVLSLNFKQMGLYYAPAFFFHLFLKICSGLNLGSAVRIAALGVVVIASFIVVWLPFLMQAHPSDQVAQLLTRVFPVGRGLYEDKVANFWCSISPIFKLQNYASQHSMVRICLVATMVGIIPSCISVVRKLRTKAVLSSHASSSFYRSDFVLFITNIAWSFFFFSFHVHEKSVLLPVFPLTIMVLQYPRLVCLVNLVSTSSMIPLLLKDGHHLSTYAVIAFYFIGSIILLQEVRRSWFQLALVGVVVPLLLDMVATFATPPARYPDIFVLLQTGYSFGVMFLPFIILLLIQLGLYESFLSKLPAFFSGQPSQHSIARAKQSYKTE